MSYGVRVRNENKTPETPKPLHDSISLQTDKSTKGKDMKRSELRMKITQAAEAEQQRSEVPKRRKRSNRDDVRDKTSDDKKCDLSPEDPIPVKLTTSELTERVLLQLGAFPDDGFVLYGGKPHRIVRRNEHYFLEGYTREALLGYLGRKLNFVVSRDDDDSCVAANPPRRLADDLLNLPEYPETIPSVKWIKNVPLLTPDGTLLAQSGLYPEYHVFLDLEGTLEDMSLPEEIKAKDLSQAVATILDPFDDFPVDESSVANLFALLFTMVFRDLIDGVTPLFCIDANQPGTGKGLLCSVLSMIAYGQEVEISPGNVGPDEIRKRLFAVAAQGTRLHVLDNVEYKVFSPELSAWLTASTYSDRKLQESATYSFPNTLILIATGNNIRIGGDIARRTVLIRLVSSHARPEERDDFRYTHIIPHVRSRRHKILKALYTIAAAWLRRGRTVPENSPKMGSFQEWADFSSGMLDVVGATGLLENRNMLRIRDQDADDCEIMLARGYEAFHNQLFTAKELASVLEPDEVPCCLNSSSCRSFTKRMGRLLARIEGRAFGEEELTVHAVQERNHTKQYRIDTKSETTPTTDGKDI